MASGSVRPTALAAGALIGGLCLGCASQQTTGTPHARPAPAAATTSVTSSPPAARPGPTPSRHPQPAGPAHPPIPAATSGRLSVRVFPRPGVLGPGWRYWVDPGDPEAGYVGNGTPALARDPAEFVATAVPLGCRRPAAMPTPDHVLEVDYRDAQVKVVTLRATFPAGQARRFFAGRLANLRACQGTDTGTAEGVLVRQVAEQRPGVVLSDRTPDSPAHWAELALLDHRSVVLVAAQTQVGQPPMTDRGVRRIAAAFR